MSMNAFALTELESRLIHDTNQAIDSFNKVCSDKKLSNQDKQIRLMRFLKSAEKTINLSASRVEVLKRNEVMLRKRLRIAKSYVRNFKFIEAKRTGEETIKILSKIN